MCVERVAVELEDVEKLKNNSATKRMLEEIDLGQRRHTGKVRSSVDVAAAFREAVVNGKYARQWDSWCFRTIVAACESDADRMWLYRILGSIVSDIREANEPFLTTSNAAVMQIITLLQHKYRVNRYISA